MSSIRFFSLMTGILLSLSMQSQSLVSSAGESFSNESLQISWSLGELVVETFTSDSYIITQGLHQSLLSPNSIMEGKNNADGDYSIYPNPTNDELFIKFNEKQNPENRANRIIIYDTQGRAILEENILNNPHEIGISMLDGGLYYLKLFHTNQNLNRTITFQKLN